jgi:hypothetical protein
MYLYVMVISETLTSMHERYSIQDDGTRSQDATSALLPADRPLKARKISVIWGPTLPWIGCRNLAFN